MLHADSLHLLWQSLNDLQQRRTSVDRFCGLWRAQSALLQALPDRYAEVMEDLLGRMEAGALFTEESCSFSQEDLRASLSVWLDKASQKLAA